MAYFKKGNARIYYEDIGEGEPILVNHGLSEDTGYWSETGVTAALAEKYRVISIDMRGHGRTIVEGEAKGYDEVTMGADLDALAEHLGIDRFHLLSHATGGMYAVRYGIRKSARLLSLMLTDTGSETLPTMYHPDGREITSEDMAQARKAAAEASKTMPETSPREPDFDERKAAWRANPGVFTFKMEQHPDSDEMFKVLDGFYQRRLSNPAMQEFMASFYSDPDPMVEGLRQVQCPTLILIGEHDIVFIKPSDLMAQEIPDNRHLVMPGIGHMTAIEDSEGTIRELMDFLDCVATTGRANR
ncbi:MAG: alpha/beta hydrolase [Gammaproteobacteria bacterium]|nr:alpha/beta hydrolase [Gammaproteobacteria bacterium]